MKTSNLSYSKIVPRLTRSVEIAGTVMALGAMIVLALRAALRLELRWDTFAYHLPFAAMRGGLHIPYELPPFLQACFHGFPPLPEFIQGVLWRTTGSINATGVVNYLAFALFLFFAWRELNARLWVVVLLSLTAPLVLIHAASSYVDLFSNSLLAIGVTAFIAMLLSDRWLDSRLLVWALAGLAGAVEIYNDADRSAPVCRLLVFLRMENIRYKVSPALPWCDDCSLRGAVALPEEHRRLSQSDLARWHPSFEELCS